jgi:hypothetical protein
MRCMPFRLLHVLWRYRDGLRRLRVEQAVPLRHQLRCQLRHRNVRRLGSDLPSLRHGLQRLQRYKRHRLYGLPVVRALPSWWRLPRRLSFDPLREQCLCVWLVRFELHHMQWGVIYRLHELPRRHTSSRWWSMHLP